MSNALSSLCRRLQMPATPKCVFMAMADLAYDDGRCLYSIESICEWTCFSKRAVIDAIKWLESNQALVADRSNGRRTTYRLTPESYQQPVQLPHRSAGERSPQPVQQMHL